MTGVTDSNANLFVAIQYDQNMCCKVTDPYTMSVATGKITLLIGCIIDSVELHLNGEELTKDFRQRWNRYGRMKAVGNHLHPLSREPIDCFVGRSSRSKSPKARDGSSLKRCKQILSLL
jgi:hypothetical protein